MFQQFMKTVLVCSIFIHRIYFLRDKTAPNHLHKYDHHTIYIIIKARRNLPGKQTPTRCYRKQNVKAISSFGWDVKPLVPMCCVTHIKEPSALIEKIRGSPGCSWLWLLYAPQHLVNPYKVLTNRVSKFITAITYLSESLSLSALSTLFG